MSTNRSIFLKSFRETASNFMSDKKQAYIDLKKNFPTARNDFPSKILYKMAWDRNPKMKIFADKLLARKFIGKTIGFEYLPKIYSTNSDVSKLKFEGLPNHFVLKVNHGSGGIIVVSPLAPKSNKLPTYPEVGWTRFYINSESFDPKLAKSLLNYWMNLDYEWWTGRNPEWAYRKIKKKVFIEEYIAPKGNFDLTEYKIFCFNGLPQVIRMSRGNVSQLKEFAHYDVDWNYLPITFIEGAIPCPSLNIESAPKFLNQMLQVARRLATNLDFIRIDFIENDGKFLVGEMTNYPTAGNFNFDPELYEIWIGKDWAPNYKNYLTTVRNLLGYLWLRLSLRFDHNK